MRSILISADKIGEFFDALSLTNKGNGIYIYAGNEALGDSVGQTTTLKGLAINGFDAAPTDEKAVLNFFGAYTVEAESNTVDEFYLDVAVIRRIMGFVSAINEACGPSKEEIKAQKETAQEGDEDFYVPVRLTFEGDADGNTKITVKPATGDAKKDQLVYGAVTQLAELDKTGHFPARSAARIIQGEGLDVAPFYEDKTDVDENPLRVPDGPVTVWEVGPQAPMTLALNKAKSLEGKSGKLAVMKHHSSRIHTLRVGENWFGAVMPFPMKIAELDKEGIYADTESLNVQHDFVAGLPEADATSDQDDEAKIVIKAESGHEISVDANTLDTVDDDDDQEEFGFDDPDDDPEVAELVAAELADE